MDNKLILDMENELENEIKMEKISLEDLNHFGFSESILKQEIFLKQIYGDDFIDIETSQKTTIDDTKKMISKISLNEIEKISVVQQLMDKLKDTEFNQNLNYVMIKLREEEDDD